MKQQIVMSEKETNKGVDNFRGVIDWKTKEKEREGVCVCVCVCVCVVYKIKKEADITKSQKHYFKGYENKR